MGEGLDFSFPSNRRLRHRSEFLRVREKGAKHHTSNFLILVLDNPCGPTRLGITVSRKVGGAVIRNRVKRLVREYFRRNYPDLPVQIDISVIAKKGASRLSYKEVCGELDVISRKFTRPQS